jgi:hypothetical protein
MRLREHVALLIRIYAESGIGVVVAPVLALGTLVGVWFNYVANDDQREKFAEPVRNVIGYWPYALFALCVIVIFVLYRRLLPTVDILYVENDSRFYHVENNIRRFRVDCINNGSERIDDVSFRLDYLREEGGENILGRRPGFQREAGRGPMPLSPGSPKSAFLVEYDEGQLSASDVKLLIIAPLSERYEDRVIELSPLKIYYLDVSLNPPVGRPRRKRFRVAVEAGAPSPLRYEGAPRRLTVSEVMPPLLKQSGWPL